MTEKQDHLVLEASTVLQTAYQASGSPELFHRTLTGAVTWQQRNETTVARALRSPDLAPQWVAVLPAWSVTC